MNIIVCSTIVNRDEIANEILIFRVKKKWEEIKSTKSIRDVEEIVSLKSLFDLSRYLNLLPRYKDSKFL